MEKMQLIDLIKYIRTQILFKDYNSLSFNFEDDAILCGLYNDEVSIMIKYFLVYNSETKQQEKKLTVFLESELLHKDLTTSEILEIGKVCEVLENNLELFQDLIRKD